jgi:hypothetical protein
MGRGIGPGIRLIKRVHEDVRYHSNQVPMSSKIRPIIQLISTEANHRKPSNAMAVRRIGHEWTTPTGRWNSDDPATLRTRPLHLNFGHNSLAARYSS